MEEITPRAYQQKILDNVAHLSSVALFMGTGSGKTYTSLFKVKESGTSKLLVVCPQKVIIQWENSIKKVLPNYRIAQFKKSWSAEKKAKYLDENLDNIDCVIINYDVIVKFPKLKYYINKKWSIILDESHRIKEVGTPRKPKKSTYFVISLGDNTDSKIILTATPTQKDKGGYVDYYAQLRFLGYINYSYERFCDTYVNFKKLQVIGMPYPIKVIDSYTKKVTEIDNLLQQIAVRYVPVFTEQPPTYIKVDIPKCASYSRMVREKYYEDINMTNLSARRIARKTLTGGMVTGRDMDGTRLTYDDNDNKVDWLMDFIEDCDDNVLVFYKYNVEMYKIVAKLKEKGISYLVVNGELKNKFEAVRDTKAKVILGQFGACGESLDGLQHKTHTCIYYAMPESSLEYRQALGRVYRDGQLYSPNYYFLVMENTIDADIYKMIQSKIDFSEETLDKLVMED